MCECNETKPCSVCQPAQLTTKQANAACTCIPDAGIVCDRCAEMAEKNVNELSAYVNDFINKRFPSGLEGDMRTIIVECVLDAFHDGARWSEAQPPGDPGLIITDLDAPLKKSSIIISSR